MSRDSAAADGMIVRAGRTFLGLIFLAAGVGKILDVATFADVLYRFSLLPIAAVNSAAVAIPFIDLMIGVLLILGVLRRPALILALTASVVFTIATLQAAIRGIGLDCGCFGSVSWLSGTPIQSSIRNVALVCLSGLLVAVQFRVERGQGNTLDTPASAVGN